MLVSSATLFSFVFFGPASPTSMRGKSGWISGSGVPGSRRPQARSSGAGGPAGRPIIASNRSMAVGITGQAITAMSRIASSSR